MKAFFLILLTLMAFVAYSPALHAGEDKDTRRSCDQIKKQLKGLTAEKQKLSGQKAALESEFAKAREKFESYRSRLGSMSGCSKGNPDNSAGCEEVLKGLDLSGTEMNRADEQKKSIGQGITGLENQLVQPQAEWKAYGCK